MNILANYEKDYKVKKFIKRIFTYSAIKNIVKVVDKRCRN